MFCRVVVPLFEDVAERCTGDSVSDGSIHGPEKAFDLPLNHGVRRGAAHQLMPKREANLFEARGVKLETAVDHQFVHHAIRRPIH